MAKKKAAAKKGAGVKPTGVITTEERKRMKAKTFGLPPTKDEPGRYPMPDKAHAANAKARATQQYKAGNLSKVELKKIHAKADRILYGSVPKAVAAGAVTAATTKGGGKQPVRPKTKARAAKRRG